jgi:hypothetical protein
MFEVVKLIQDWIDQLKRFLPEHVQDKKISVDLKEIRISLDIVITDLDPERPTQKSITDLLKKR